MAYLAASVTQNLQTRQIFMGRSMSELNKPERQSNLSGYSRYRACKRALLSWVDKSIDEAEKWPPKIIRTWLLFTLEL